MTFAVRSAGALLAALLLIALAAQSAAADSAPLRVTFVARVCNSYTDISANRARNNIQESLRDLGADTAYQSGQTIDPATEKLNQPSCEPLPDWRFTLGTSYRSQAVAGPWGSLSNVTNPFDTSIVTQRSVPLLDRNGDRPAPTSKER